MGEATKVEIQSAKVKQTSRFYREGTVLGGDISAGPVELITVVELESQATEQEVLRVIKLAEASCFAIQSMMLPVPVTIEARLNGFPLAMV